MATVLDVVTLAIVGATIAIVGATFVRTSGRRGPAIPVALLALLVVGGLTHALQPRSWPLATTAGAPDVASSEPVLEMTTPPVPPTSRPSSPPSPEPTTEPPGTTPATPAPLPTVGDILGRPDPETQRALQSGSSNPVLDADVCDSEITRWAYDTLPTRATLRWSVMLIGPNPTDPHPVRVSVLGGRGVVAQEISRIGESVDLDIDVTQATRLELLTTVDDADSHNDCQGLTVRWTAVSVIAA